MDDDVGINVGKNFKTVGKEKLIELSERQQNIISVVKYHPAITIPELAQRMSGKKTVTTRTIERDIAALQAKGILKREGGRKSGKCGENGAFPPTRNGCIHSLSMRERG